MILAALWMYEKASVLPSECHFRNLLYLMLPHAKGHTHTHRKNRWHETSQSHSLTVRVITVFMRWMKLRWGDSVTRLSLHSWGMLISWLWHCVPWCGMCHLPCHLIEQETLVALPRGLPSRSSTADTGEGYSQMETDGTYGGQLMRAPGWHDRRATTLKIYTEVWVNVLFSTATLYI